jgi:hypothetical protein
MIHLAYMKRFSILLFFLFSLGTSTLLFAQNQPAPTRDVTNPAPDSECTDKVDNDQDGRIDRVGGVFNGKTYLPDPDCLAANATSEGVKASGASSGMPINVTINNPLKVDTIQGAIKLFMDAVLRIALPFIVVFFIWSGFSFVLARGKPDGITKAKNMFLYTVIGTLLILGAWVITNAIIGTVNSITS